MSEYRWLNDLSRKFLAKDYLLPGQTAEGRVDEICETAERTLGKPGFAGRLRENVKKGWYSLSSPIWSNFGRSRGMPISCFGSYIEDKSESISYTHAEVSMMTKFGGGTSAYFGDVRGRGSHIRDNGESFGSVHFAQLFDLLINVWSQGSTRRGNFAGCWPIDHPDVMEVLAMRSGGSPIQDLSFAVCVPDRWMREMISGDAAKRRVWAKVIETRLNTGFPYVFWVDNANRNKPDVYKDKDYKIYHSNLCHEICLPDGPDESFVCCLSSMNVLYYDEWKDDPGAVEALVYLLDAVLTEFIEKARGVMFMERAVRFAERHRAIGVGWLGWHSYLQSKMIPFESAEAKRSNVEVAKSIFGAAQAASRKLAAEYGEPELLRGYGRRNTTTCAIAPTKSSSFIMGQVSEGIEPFHANVEIKDRAKGKFTVKNHHLERLLRERGRDTPETWESILRSGGSVQHLDFLSARERAVFKTFAEISPAEVVAQAAQRQRHLDQSQSLNLMIDPRTPVRDINRLMIDAWESGVVSLYYQIGENAAQNFARNVLACSSCEA